MEQTILLEAYNRKYGTFYFTDLEHLHNTIGKTMCWQIGTVINGLNDNIPINPTKDDVYLNSLRSKKE